MHILVSAALGALICGAIGAIALAQNWSYARKQGQIGTVAGYSLIGGGVAGAIIGAFL